MGVRSSNSTPIGGVSAVGAGATQSRKSPNLQGDAGQKDENRASSRGSGGRSQNDNQQQRGQRASNNGGSAPGGQRGVPRGGRARGQNRGGNGQSTFNRFAGSSNRPAPKGPLKFDEDYDFESANTKVN